METYLPWRRKAIYWSSISQTFLEQLKQHKHFADMNCVSTSGPGQAPPGSAEGLGRIHSSEVPPWPSPRLPPSGRVTRPCLSSRTVMLLQLTGNPEPSHAAAGAQPWGCPAQSEVWQHSLQLAPRGKNSCLGQARKVY